MMRSYAYAELTEDAQLYSQNHHCSICGLLVIAVSLFGDKECGMLEQAVSRARAKAAIAEL